MAQQPVSERLFTPYGLHYLVIGLAGVVFLVAGIYRLGVDGFAMAHLLSMAGGVLVGTWSGYALTNPDGSGTEIGGPVWFAMVGSLLLILLMVAAAL